MTFKNRRLKDGRLATFFFDKEGFMGVQVGSIQYGLPFIDTPLEQELKEILDGMDKDKVG